MRCLILPGLLLGSPLAAQTAPPAPQAVWSITAVDVARRIGIIADDSMMGRDTPSRGLDLTAEYVAAQFRGFGLKTTIQRYPITRRRLLPAQSRVVFSADGQKESASFTNAARHDGGVVPDQPVKAGAILVGGALTVDSAARLEVRDKAVVFVPPATPDPKLLQQVLRALFLAGPKALIIMSNADSAAFANAIPKHHSERTVIGMPTGKPITLQVHPSAVKNALAAAGVDLSAVRGASAAVTRDIPSLRIGVEMKDTITSSLTAPNTVGILEGSDSRLKHEYVLYSAHMDHVGIKRGRPDSIHNGADDNASGTAGVIELAEAFSRPGARPKRSMIFLTVSGEEKGLWGSAYFADNPPVPLKQIVAAINIDMIGRNWADTIVAIGKEHSDLGATLNRVNAAHPELRMVAIDDRWPEEQFFFRSDHYNFARKGVPILFFFNGVHEDYHEVTDSPDKINSEKEARILKLLFYLGQEVARAPKRPAWDPESYQAIVD
ncbi:MAG TPA: M28 family peptidase [Gemmatimonadales bacterium]|nr:M28 family peptidase [Gemmatimonadales bacterium]